MVRQNVIWIFKSVKQMIICIILFIAFILGFIYIGTLDFTKEEVSDSEKFTNEHKEVDSDNVYSYINVSDAYTYIKGSNVVMLFGTSDSDWVGYYANVLNDAAKEVGLDKIYYYDVKNDREERNATYESIANYLSSYLTHFADGSYDIYVPLLVIKKNNKIYYFDDETSMIKGEKNAKDYWTDSAIELKKLNLKAALKDYMGDNYGNK